jgi:hypothetical protein
VRALQVALLYILLIACTASTSEAQTVYITKTGEKYHRSSCQYLRKSKYAVSMTEAVERGYTACSVCQPGTPKAKVETKPSQSTTSKQKVTESVRPKTSTSENAQVKSMQCTATTKAGTRCKRMTTNATGKCYQHQ